MCDCIVVQPACLGSCDCTVVQSVCLASWEFVCVGGPLGKNVVQPKDELNLAVG